MPIVRTAAEFRAAVAAAAAPRADITLQRITLGDNIDFSSGHIAGDFDGELDGAGFSFSGLQPNEYLFDTFTGTVRNFQLRGGAIAAECDGGVVEDADIFASANLPLFGALGEESAYLNRIIIREDVSDASVLSSATPPRITGTGSGQHLSQIGFGVPTRNDSNPASGDDTLTTLLFDAGGVTYRLTNLFIYETQPERRQCIWFRINNYNNPPRIIRNYKIRITNGADSYEFFIRQDVSNNIYSCHSVPDADRAKVLRIFRAEAGTTIEIIDPSMEFGWVAPSATEPRLYDIILTGDKVILDDETDATIPAFRAAIEGGWTEVFGETDGEHLVRKYPYLAPGDLPPGAKFGVQVFRNRGGGWQLLAGDGEADHYPLDGLMTPDNNGNYSFTDPAPAGDSASYSGRAADVGLQRDWFEEPPVGAANIARHANGFWICNVGDTIYASLSGAPTAWPAERAFQLPDKILRLIEFSDMFLALGNNKMFLISGVAPENLSSRDSEIIYAPTGAAARVGGEVEYFCGEGIVGFAGGAPALRTGALATARDFDRFPRGESFAASTDARFYLFHGGEVMVYSLRDGGILSRIQFNNMRVFAAEPLPDGQLALAGENNDREYRVWRWNPVPPLAYPRMTATWRSRVFRMTRPTHIRAVKVRIGDSSKVAALAPDTLNIAADGFLYGVGAGGAVGAPGAALGLFPNYPGTMDNEDSVEVKIFGDDVLRVIEPSAQKWKSQAFDIAGNASGTDWFVEVRTKTAITGVALGRSKHEMRRAGV